MTPARKTESYLGLGMEDIIVQQRLEQEAVREAVAKRSMQEIQQEQEFQQCPPISNYLYLIYCPSTTRTLPKDPVYRLNACDSMTAPAFGHITRLLSTLQQMTFIELAQIKH
ncbi:hypothetical protein HYQ46_011203 [Verticillium longisporum]|nr:hypothetical protein HYQ46_011203 [Verticillium longisporum]